MEEELRKLPITLMNKKELKDHLKIHSIGNSFNTYVNGYIDYDLYIFVKENNGYRIAKLPSYDSRGAAHLKIQSLPGTNLYEKYGSKIYQTAVFLPIIRINDPDLMQKLINSSNAIFDGTKIIYHGKYPYRYLSEEESQLMEKVYNVGNLIYTGNTYNGEAEVLYKDNYYIRETRNHGIKWVELNDLIWCIDEKGKKLVCINYIDSMRDYMNVKTQLTKIGDAIQQHRLTTSEYNLFLTYKERENTNYFFFLHPLTLETLGLEEDLIKKLNDWSTLENGTDYYFALGGKLKIYEDEILKDKVNFGIRPIVNYSRIKNKSRELKSPYLDYFIVQYGEYPQTLVDSEHANKLEKKFLQKMIHPTGKTYTSIHQECKPLGGIRKLEYTEYEYEGSKYIRMSTFDKEALNSNCLHYSRNFDRNVESIWIKVEPVEWYVDKKTGKAICIKDLFFSDPISKDDFISVENMNRYILKHFEKEIVPSQIEYKITNQENIMSEIIKRKKEKLEQIEYIINKNKKLQKLMADNDLKLSDVDIDENGKLLIRGLKVDVLYEK